MFAVSEHDILRLERIQIAVEMMTSHNKRRPNLDAEADAEGASAWVARVGWFERDLPRQHTTSSCHVIIGRVPMGV